MSTTSTDPADRDATPQELKALGHPLRWRILRVTLEKPLTNKQIAARLGRDPGTTLHHVRVLVDAGFLAPEDVRAGTRGAWERPYRATGKSWRIRLTPRADNTVAILDAAREEILEAGQDAALGTLRLAVRLKPDDVTELKRRVADLGDEFAKRDDPAGEPIGIAAFVHRRRP
jgi:DNA-binding transcriptional ArsR family regulator